jgi:hypothetical protein
MHAPDLTRAVWRKSSYSGADYNNCVEVAAVERLTAIRDSKNPTGPMLTFTAPAWRRFVHKTTS